jgi:hypothetical protein
MTQKTAVTSNVSLTRSLPIAESTPPRQLRFHLGSPTEMIPVGRPHIADADIQAVTAVLEAGFVSGEAPIVAEFEREFASAVNRNHGIAAVTGSGLELVANRSQQCFVVTSRSSTTHL